MLFLDDLLQRSSVCKSCCLLAAVFKYNPKERCHRRHLYTAIDYSKSVATAVTLLKKQRLAPIGTDWRFGPENSFLTVINVRLWMDDTMADN